MNHKILFIIFTILSSSVAFADNDSGGKYARDSTKVDPGSNNGQIRSGVSVIQGTVADWINTGGTTNQCDEGTKIIDTADFSSGTAIPACPKGTKGVLTYSAGQQFYMPAENDVYNNGWRAAVGDTPICINNNKNYSLNICAYVGYNNGGDYYCGPVYMQYTITCVPQSDTSYQDPSCSGVSIDQSCKFATGIPQAYPKDNKGATIPFLPR